MEMARDIMRKHENISFVSALAIGNVCSFFRKDSQRQFQNPEETWKGSQKRNCKKQLRGGEKFVDEGVQNALAYDFAHLESIQRVGTPHVHQEAWSSSTVGTGALSVVIGQQRQDDGYDVVHVNGAPKLQVWPMY
jgi:hypothetical protein